MGWLKIQKLEYLEKLLRSYCFLAEVTFDITKTEVVIIRAKGKVFDTDLK